MADHYPDLLNREAPIYNGKMYHPYIKLSENGHPFFNSERYTQGSIVYSGYTYRHVKIAYDLVRDQLILMDFDGDNALVVVPDHVDSFTLHNHTFIRLTAGAATANTIKPGYYDLLYKGRIRLLAKRLKSVSEKVTQNEVEKNVSQQDKYYLFKDSVYTAITNKKALLKMLQSTQSQNQHFIKTEQLNFKRDKENAIIKLVKFHDSIAQ